jgi:germacradienol/geosmin synthase
MKSLENAAQDYGMLINDVFSYQKEIEFDGEFHNLIRVVQNFFDVDYPTGLAVVHDLMTGRMKQFEHVVAHELPVLYDDFELGADARRVLDGYVQELRDWMSGILVWHQECRRYGEADILRRRRPAQAPVTLTIPGPSGLGTSAARLFATR